MTYCYLYKDIIDYKLMYDVIKQKLNFKEVEHIFVENLFRSWNLLRFFSCQ